MIAQRRPELVEVQSDEWESPRGQSEALDVQRYLDAFRRYWWVALAAMLVGVLVAGAWTLRQPKMYRTSASVVIETRTPRVLTGVEEVVDEASTGWVPANFFETEYEVMRSRAVASGAAEDLGLIDDDKRNGLAGLDPEERARRKAALDPADLVIGHYTIEPDRKSNVVRVVVEDADPKFAADLANAVVESYRDHNRDKRVGGTKDASKWLAVQHDDLRKKLDASEQALIKFMADNDILNASLESQLEEVKQRSSAFNAQLAEEEASKIRDVLNVTALKQVRENPTLVDTLPEIQAAGVINTLKTRLVELHAQETDLEARYQPEHPKVKLVHEQIAAIEKDLKAEVDAVLTSLERAKAAREEAIRGLKQALDAERMKEARLNKLSLDYQALQRERDTNVHLFEMVTSRMKEADITSALPFNNVRPLDSALVPKAPFKPNPRTNVLVGLLAGLFLGVCIIVLIELADNTIKSQDDVEQLKLPFLGLLPIIEGPPEKDGEDAAANKRERDLHVLRSPRSAVAECARFIRTNLLFMSPDAPLKMLVVTSPGPQEGKTTTAVNVAVTMAQAGSRTLLVDTDLRRPRLHHVFGLPTDVGLTSVLVGDCPLQKAIHATEVAGLDVLVCGPPPPNPAEILLSDRFKELVADLGKKYDRVIFDTSPIGPVTDPAILGGLVDGVVLIVKCGKTRKDATKQGLRSLDDANARVLGAILNDVDVTSKRYSGVYYSYYRRYTSYYSDSPAPTSSPVVKP